MYYNVLAPDSAGGGTHSFVPLRNKFGGGQKSSFVPLRQKGDKSVMTLQSLHFCVMTAMCNDFTLQGDCVMTLQSLHSHV